ncbi:MAG: pantoate--beta-alanine ligase [Opitutales bacterium]
MMEILKSVQEVRAWRSRVAGSCGFVPTMGALHLGHESLIRRASDTCDASVVSIFVNPTQFNDPSDFEAYPVTLDADLEKSEAAGANAVFIPDENEIYADGRSFKLSESVVSREMEGRERPGHFDGVLTVVMKLLNIVNPTHAFFGEKDYQQFLLIERMAKAFFLECEIVPCATVREADGLAFSSRNRRLTDGGRKRAPDLHHQLSTAGNAAEASRALKAAGFSVEYIEEHWGRRFGAVQLDGVRLIDNLEILR